MAENAAPAVEPAYVPLEPEREAAVARMIVAAMPNASLDGAGGFLRTMAEDPLAAVYVAPAEGDPLALYVLRKNGLATDLLLIVVDPDASPDARLEVLAVRDAGDRIGKRPLTVETSERALEWYKSLGFKLVGKRKKPDGSFGYRLGWHAPKPGQAAPGGPGEPCPEPGELLGQHIARGREEGSA
jgi:ribosomal protein S18 acetylase RimI-like enzyme